MTTTTSTHDYKLYGEILMYIVGFGLSDLLVQHFNFSSRNKIFYYACLFIIAIILIYLIDIIKQKITDQISQSGDD